MSEKLTNVEILRLLNAETPTIDPRVGELLRDLFTRVDELERQVADLRA
ncbi:hypothetical protein ACF07D_07510 [Leucobacter sp. NPDC015123]